MEDESVKRFERIRLRLSSNSQRTTTTTNNNHNQQSQTTTNSNNNHKQQQQQGTTPIAARQTFTSKVRSQEDPGVTEQRTDIRSLCGCVCVHDNGLCSC